MFVSKIDLPSGTFRSKTGNDPVLCFLPEELLTMGSLRLSRQFQVPLQPLGRPSLSCLVMLWGVSSSRDDGNRLIVPVDVFAFAVRWAGPRLGLGSSRFSDACRVARARAGSPLPSYDEIKTTIITV